GGPHLEKLGNHDSGMEGWPQNAAPGSFWMTPVGDAAPRVADLMQRYQPQVVVTYDEHGLYGHPDHVQAHRVTMAAADATGVPAKVYYLGVPRSALTGFADVLRQHGIEPPTGMEEDPQFGTADELITTVVDCAGFTRAKYDSLAAHA